MSERFAVSCKTRFCLPVSLVLCVLCSPGTASAQGNSAVQALANLIVPSTSDFSGSTGDATSSVILLDTFATEVTTFPLGSSSSGFTWSFDPTLGVQTRRSNSFGPMFAERPLTNGRQKLNVAFAWQHTKFDSIAGQPLDNLVSTYPVFSNLTGARIGTVNGESHIELATDRYTLAASYGITDRVDVGIVLPFGRTMVVGNSLVRGFLLGQTTPLSTQTIAVEDASSAGVGDIILRGKFALPSTGALDLAAGASVRFPSGDPEKFMGLKSKAAAIMFMGAAPLGTISPHVNVGYTFVGKSDFFDVANEVNYTFGVDVAATPGITIVGDVVGRALRDAANVDYASLPNGSTIFRSSAGTVNLLLGTVGTKIKVGGNWLFTANVLIPLNSAGVKPRITPMIGFERAL